MPCLWYLGGDCGRQKFGRMMDSTLDWRQLNLLFLQGLCSVVAGGTVIRSYRSLPCVVFAALIP